MIDSVPSITCAGAVVITWWDGNSSAQEKGGGAVATATGGAAGLGPTLWIGSSVIHTTHVAPAPQQASLPHVTSIYLMSI